MTDIVTFGETMLRLSPPEGERLETTGRFDVMAAGAESNVAVAAANLGADAVWLSRLPDSPLGRRVVRELRSHGVRTGVSWAPGTERMGTYYLEFGGEPRGTQVIYDRAGAAFTDIQAGNLPTPVVENATYFHTTGITPALSPPAAKAVAALLETAENAGTKTVFDLNYRGKLWSVDQAREGCEALFPNVDVLVVAIRDARRVLDQEGDAVEIAHSLRTAYDFDTVVLTRGAHGALAVHDDEVHEQAAFRTDTVDAIGTGDAFVGGFLTNRVEGGTMQESLAWGAATAAIKRTLSGDAAVVSREEVEKVVQQETERISR